MREPPALNDKAAEDLKYIRRTMEEAGRFTAVPGRGMALIGVLALVAAFVLRHEDPSSLRWLGTWLVTAAAAAAVGTAAAALKARRSGTAFLSGPAQRFILIFLLPVAAGAILTRVFVRNAFNEQLPGLWLLLYGTAVASAGTLSVRPVLVMGLLFVFAGATSLVAPGFSGTLAMAAGFGGLHVLFGVLVARRHGG